VRSWRVAWTTFLFGGVWRRSFFLRLARFGCWLRSFLRGSPSLMFLYLFSAALIFAHGLTTAVKWHAFPTEPRHDQVFRLLQWFFAGTTGPWIKALALAALIAAIISAQQMRKRIVVLTFANLTGEDTRKAFADGLGRRLMTELAEVADVYTDVSDDPSDISLDSTNTAALSLSVDPTTAFTGLTASFKEPVRLGPLSIPLDGVLTALSTLLRGPQIAGSVQKTADGLLIEASISGGGFDKTWRVFESDAEAKQKDGDPEAKVTDEMIRQLACRVFTHLNQNELGTQIWRAVKYYTDGLHAFREARLERGSTNKRSRLLQQAQQAFFGAYSVDARFVRSRYNLGVIYFSLKQWQPAYEIFQKVVNDSDGDPLPSTPGSRTFKRARRDLALAHYAAARAAMASEPFLQQEKLNQLDSMKQFLQLDLPGRWEDLQNPNRKKPLSQVEVFQLEKLNRRKRAEELALLAKQKPLEPPEAEEFYQLKRERLAHQLALQRLEKRWPMEDPDPAKGIDQLNKLLQEEKRFSARGDRPDYHCDQAIKVAPEESGAWNLKGIRKLPTVSIYGPEPSKKTLLTEAQKARSYHQKATALSWRELCIAEWKGRPSTNLLSQSIIFLANLAYADAVMGSVYRRRGTNATREPLGLARQKRRGAARRCLSEISQALYLDPSNALNWARLGKLELALGKPLSALTAFQNANREQETGRHWLWIACARQLLSHESPAKREEHQRLAREALKNASEGVAGEWLFEHSPSWVDGFLEEWKTWKELAPRLDKVETFMATECTRLNAIQKSIQLDIRKLTSDPTDDDQRVEQEVLTNWAEEYYRTDTSARLTLTAAAALQSHPWPNWQSPDDFKQRHRLVLKALELKPLGAPERNLLGELCFDLKLLERSEAEIVNALSIEPEGKFQPQFTQIKYEVFLTVTDKTVRAKAIRRIVDICREFTATDGTETGEFRTDPIGIAYWHFWLGVYSFELLEFQTAQKSFETCFARRFMPIESLQRLCLAHFRCGAFEEAEQTYKRLENFLLSALSNPDVEAVQGDRFKSLNEVQAPAFHWSLAANHSAAALAEQGLVEAAVERWMAGKSWGDKLVASITPDPVDLRRGLGAAQSLCRGAILLNAGILGAEVPDPEAGSPPAGYKGSKYIWQLEEAINCFTYTIGSALDTAVRADANYRIGVACEALSRLDPADKTGIWRARGVGALRIAQLADRRDEYADRIPALLAKLNAPVNPNQAP